MTLTIAFQEDQRMTYNQTNADRDVRKAAGAVSDLAGDLADKAGRQFDRAIDQAQSTARNIGEHGREAGERVQEVAGNIKVALDKSLREQPTTTLVVAAAVGFVLGALWKS
jgi:ElaB/YqjD/DUF883 family membrane-anchored ribosome-binding protein